ncbi:nuclear nucleic acid-binding protein C1D isoform X1 [Anguilla rostrata]|uniref:nuclear nucleic acid-binding protein C1D isoform X1 n=2 Tax=Anguilla rostrata TaxID=7938 RepID=UPI0030CE9757
MQQLERYIPVKLHSCKRSNKNMCDEDGAAEDYPTEIAESLTGFDSSVGSVNKMVDTMISLSKNELLQKLDPLEQAKLDLMSAYSLNSLFWIYLVTQGINPKDHGIKQELERIRTYMNKVKEITDRKKAARLDRGAASRFVRNALWEPESEKPEAEGPHQSKRRKQS